MGQGRRKRRSRRRGAPSWSAVAVRGAVEVGALVVVALVLAGGGLGTTAQAMLGVGVGWRLVVLTAVVLALGLVVALMLRAWWRVRPDLAARHPTVPAVLSSVLAVLAVVVAARPNYARGLGALRSLVGGAEEAEVQTVAHQVYAAYRRADLAGLHQILERGRVYEATVHEAAAAFDVDPEVMMGIASAESSFYPRDSHDGGRGLFQITAPPDRAVGAARRRLGTERLDPLNQRHNAYLAAATLHEYLHEMRGDPYLALLAYNIGPRNGGLRMIMERYGARDFVTVQPYLQNLPRDYPIRVLSAALAYRLWRTEGRLPRYEDGDNAARIQQVGIPGLASRRS